MIKKASRNDLIGKILNVNEKYYIIDHGLREAILFNNEKINLVLENIIFIEMLEEDMILK